MKPITLDEFRKAIKITKTSEPGGHKDFYYAAITFGAALTVDTFRPPPENFIAKELEKGLLRRIYGDRRRQVAEAIEVLERHNVQFPSPGYDEALKQLMAAAKFSEPE